MVNDRLLAYGLEQLNLSTQTRPLRLALGLSEGVCDELLLAQRFSGKEAMCGACEYRILCVADSAFLPLKNFIGIAAELRIVTDQGRLRRFGGIVTEAASGESDGGLTTYQLVLRDALSVMEGRHNTRIFRHKNELDIVKTLVGEWQERSAILGTSFALQIAPGLDEKFARREFRMQHGESDADFIRRLLQDRGLAWCVLPGLPDRGTRPGQAASLIGHTLFVFDDACQLTPSAAGNVRFHRDAATEERDAITAWSAARTLRPGSISLHSWDYKNPSANVFMHTAAQSYNDQGLQGKGIASSLDDYHVAAPHLGEDLHDLTLLGAARMAHHDYEAKRFHAEGSVRDLAVGEWFTLQGHPEIDTHPPGEREFVVTSQHIVAQNNLPVELGARVERLFNRSGWRRGEYDLFANGDDNGEPLRYRTRFTCVRRGVRIVPPPATRPRPALQSAIVVGPENEQVWCDELGRVKVHFPATQPQGRAGGDSDSAWVRVASSWAGNGPGSSAQCGARLLPPVGAEVLVDWAGGHPDKPVIVGQLYNGAGTPPAFRHEDCLPKARYQSGIRSREVRGTRGNQLRLDDTPGQISAQLASDHAASELNLGYLTAARSDGAAVARGEGAELRSEEAIALHAARGILLSAWKLLGSSRARGGQLARDDFLALLRECGELSAALGDSAAQNDGLPFDPKEQEALLAKFSGWEDGSNTRPDAAERGAPLIGIASAAGIGFASSGAIVSYSAKNADTVAQQHLQMTAGQRVAVNAGQGISLFAQAGGLTGIAHTGKLLLQSQRDDTVINSASNLALSATEGTATVSAKVILLVAEDGSFLKLGDGPPVLGSRQPLKFHAPEFRFDGPETMAAQLPTFGEGRADQKFAVRYARGVPLEDGSRPLGSAVEDARLKVRLSDGSDLQARSGADGKSDPVERDAMHMADIDLMLGGDDEANGR